MYTNSYCYFSMDTTGYYDNGNKYWKIEQIASATYTPVSDVIYLHDDTSARKIFSIDTNTNVTKVLYDFTLQPGDSMNYLLPNETLYVDSVHYHLVNGINRKHVYLHSNQLVFPNPVVWIEGIGSTFNLTVSTMSQLIEEIHTLQCQEFDGYENFGNTASCANFVTAVSDFSTSNKIRVYPIPCQDRLYIASERMDDLLEAKIYTLDGRLLLSSTHEQMVPSLCVRDIPSGLYRLSLMDRTQQISNSTFLKE